MALTELWGLYIGGGIYLLFNATLLGVYLSRRHLEPIKSRGWQLVTISVLWCMVDTIVAVMQPGDLPLNCLAVMWFVNLFIPGIPLPHVLRAIMLYIMYTWNHKKLHPTPTDHIWFPRYRRLTQMRTHYAVIAFAFIVTLVIAGTLRFSTDPPVTNYMDATDCLAPLEYFNISQAAILVLLFFICLGLLWNSRDGYHFKAELRAFAIIFIVFYAFWAFVSMSGLLPKAMDTITPMIGTSLTNAVACLYPIKLTYDRAWRLVSASDEEEEVGYSTEYSVQEETIAAPAQPEAEAAAAANAAGADGAMALPPGVKVGTIRGTVRQRPNFKSTADLFHVILENQVLHDAFRKFALELWCVENLLFYEAASQYAKIRDPNERATQARVIIDLYVREESLREINVDDAPRNAAIAAVASGNITSETFDRLKQAVFTQMRMDTFAKFRVSEAFKKAWGDAGFGRAPVFRRGHSGASASGASGDSGHHSRGGTGTGNSSVTGENASAGTDAEQIELSATAKDLLRDSVAMATTPMPPAATAGGSAAAAESPRDEEQTDSGPVAVNSGSPLTRAASASDL